MAKESKAKGKKIGRNRKKCELYRIRGIREINKARRIEKDAKRSNK